MDGQAIMTLLKTNLTAALPARLVTRSAMDYAQRPQADLEKGVVTLIALNADSLQAPRAVQDYAGKLYILILFEFKLAETATGEEVEAAEWAFFQELQTFLKAPGLGLCPLDAQRLTLSQQRDTPYGWLGLQAVFSELD